MPATGPWGDIDALRTGRAVPGPPGWVNYCFATPDACRQRADAARVAPTADVLTITGRVQEGVNDEILTVAEPAGLDHWRLAPRAGDCEDYALTKQARLRAAGLPAGAVRLAVARLPSGERHAVVTVATTAGTLVLDNLRRDVVPLNGLKGYAWLELEQPDGRMRWHELEGAAGTTLLVGGAQ